MCQDATRYGRTRLRCITMQCGIYHMAWHNELLARMNVAGTGPENGDYGIHCTQ